MKVIHCAWPTPAPDVCTANWDQSSWDKWGEQFRPPGYKGEIHDEAAFMIWRAHELIADPSARTQVEHLRAVSTSCKHSRQSPRFCRPGTCYACTVAQVYLESKG